MSGRYAGVRLTRCSRACPSCGAPSYPYTHPHAGTIVRSSCDPYRCRIARTLRLAGRWQDRTEIQPSDDRAQSRQMFAGGAR